MLPGREREGETKNGPNERGFPEVRLVLWFRVRGGQLDVLAAGVNKATERLMGNLVFHAMLFYGRG